MDSSSSTWQNVAADLSVRTMLNRAMMFAALRDRAHAMCQPRTRRQVIPSRFRISPEFAQAREKIQNKDTPS